MHWGDMGWGWGAVLVGTIFMVLLLAGIAAVIIVALRRPTASRSSAEQILAERFARGEIDKEEYQQRRQMLRG